MNGDSTHPQNNIASKDRTLPTGNHHQRQTHCRTHPEGEGTHSPQAPRVRHRRLTLEAGPTVSVIWRSSAKSAANHF